MDKEDRAQALPPPQQQQQQCRICDLARSLLTSARELAGGGGVSDGSSKNRNGNSSILTNLPIPSSSSSSSKSGNDGGASAPQEQQQEQQPLRRADCLGCRLTGLMAGLGGAGYLSSRLLDAPPPRGAHKAVLVASSAALAGLGVARGFGWY
jgi:hypothetical protein